MQRLAMIVLLGAGGAAALMSGARADACVSVEGSELSNRCQTCMQVTLRDIAPLQSQAQGVFASAGRTVRIEPGTRTGLGGAAHVAIVDLARCE